MAEVVMWGERTIQGKTGASYLTVPKLYLRKHGLGPGSIMEVTTDGDAITYRPTKEKTKGSDDGIPGEP